MLDTRLSAIATKQDAILFLSVLHNMANEQLQKASEKQGSAGLYNKLFEESSWVRGKIRHNYLTNTPQPGFAYSKTAFSKVSQVGDWA